MEDLEFQETSIIREQQWEMLTAQLSYVASNSGYYQRIFREQNIDIKNITSYKDFCTLPITSKEELQRFNHDFIAVDEDSIIDYVTTSGTLGNPVNFALNEADLERLAENEYRSFKTAGIQRSDKVQITTTLDRRFMAGMAYFLGLRKLGAGIIRTGSGLPQLQWESIARFSPQYLVAVPSFLVKMLEYAIANNIDYRSSSVKAAICIGEPLRDQEFKLNALGTRIKQLWDIELFSTYASTEMATAFTECNYYSGYHVHSDLIFSEILDEQGKHVQPGEIGELVVTPLGVQTMPLLRFATGDMLTYIIEKCSCGRNSMRLSSVIGRKQQKLKLKGTSLYPQHIMEALNSYGKIDLFVLEAEKDELDNDRLIVKIPNENFDIAALKEYFRATLNVSPDIIAENRVVLEQLKFPKASRKPQIFRDLR